MASPIVITEATALEAVITTVLKTSEAGRVLGTGSGSATALRLTPEESPDAWPDAEPVEPESFRSCGCEEAEPLEARKRSRVEPQEHELLPLCGATIPGFRSFVPETNCQLIVADGGQHACERKAQAELGVEDVMHVLPEPAELLEHITPPERRRLGPAHGIDEPSVRGEVGNSGFHTSMRLPSSKM